MFWCPAPCHSLGLPRCQAFGLAVRSQDSSPIHCDFLNRLRSLLTSDHLEIIREKVHDGLTGETREMQYTQCKIVGNGSFGVVFQTKLSPDGEDAAIKRVLQDKRFKVSPLYRLSVPLDRILICL